ncbi:MAG: DUF4124 domain-containing protein [Neisseriaceae bacterium]|nr:DUF4124 domain-containing protein [Neisseriaceae bacterium]MBQ9682330.1 DUF4124 domain-containing protein [Neisseriaceae bacterium]
MKKSVLLCSLLAAFVVVNVADAAPRKQDLKKAPSIRNVQIPAAAGSGPFYWEENGVTQYSDTPRGHQTVGVGLVNVRTHAVEPLKVQNAAGEVMSDEERAMSLAQRQAKLNEEIAAENKRREEENARRAEEAKKTNCNTARMNLQNVQNANRMENREAAIARFQADVSKYCE